jgi:hypothetical protein
MLVDASTVGVWWDRDLRLLPKTRAREANRLERYGHARPFAEINGQRLYFEDSGGDGTQRSGGP